MDIVLSWKAFLIFFITVKGQEFESSLSGLLILSSLGSWDSGTINLRFSTSILCLTVPVIALSLLSH